MLLSEKQYERPLKAGLTHSVHVLARTSSSSACARRAWKPLQQRGFGVPWASPGALTARAAILAHKKKRFCAAILSSRPPLAFADSRGKHAQGRLFAAAVRDVGAAHATETDRRFGGERGVDGRALEAEAARDDNLPRAAAPTPTSHWPGP